MWDSRCGGYELLEDQLDQRDCRTKSMIEKEDIKLWTEKKGRYKTYERWCKRGNWETFFTFKKKKDFAFP